MQIDNIDKKIPKHTQQILTALNNAGFEAYIVGGAVRDLLLGRIPATLISLLMHIRSRC